MLNANRWLVEEITYAVRDPATCEPCLVEGRRVYPVEVPSGPVCEAMQIIDNGVVTGWIAWRLDKFGATVRVGQIKPTFEAAFDHLKLDEGGLA